MTLVKGNRQLLILVIILGIFSLGTFNISFVPWKSQDFGITDNDIPLVYAECDSYYNRIPIGVLEDKIGKEKVLTFGLSIFVLSLMLIVLFFLDSNQYLFPYVIAAIFGLYIETIETVQRARTSHDSGNRPNYSGIARHNIDIATW